MCWQRLRCWRHARTCRPVRRPCRRQNLRCSPCYHLTLMDFGSWVSGNGAVRNGSGFQAIWHPSPDCSTDNKKTRTKMHHRLRLTAVPLECLISFDVFAQSAPDAAARTNAEQQQQVEQRRDAQQRAATVAAPVVRSTAPVIGEYPVLPVETPCFRIDTFTVEVP